MLRLLIQFLPIGWMGRLALLRLTSQWRSLLTLVIGVLLAAVIGANAPLYTSTVAQVGMVQRLSQRPTEDRHLFSRVSVSTAQVDDFAVLWVSLNTAVTDAVTESFTAFPTWIENTVNWGETSPMMVVRDGADIPDTQLRLAYYSGLQEHINLIDGTWPTDSPNQNSDIEIALTENVARSLDVSVGDTIVLDQRGWDTSLPVRAVITAIFRPQDEDAEYWFNPSPLRVVTNAQFALDANVFTTQDSFSRVVVEFIPETRTQIGWRLVFDHAQLPFRQAAQGIEILQAFEQNLPDVLHNATEANMRPVINTGLANALSGYGDEIVFLNAPFNLLLLQLGVLVLFFLVLTAALVRRGERREIALFQSRGAYDRQILILRGVEALLICAGVTILAPFIARQLLLWLTPIYTGIDNLPLELDSSAFVYGGIASVVAFILLVVTLRPVLAMPLVQAGGSASRGETQTFWQRYYLDVVVLVIGVLALGRLGTTQSLLSGAGSDVQADPLLLIAPALLFVGLGSVLLRLFPAAMRVIARIYGRRRGLTNTLAAWQVSREPLHYGRITFLLALAVGIGGFAITFQYTMARSHDDQARYAVGTDIRFTVHDEQINADRAQAVDYYESIPGVDHATVIARIDNFDLGANVGLPETGAVLAIDSATFNQAAYWRDDYGLLTIPQLPDVNLTPGRLLPILPARVRLSVRFEGWTRPSATEEPEFGVLPHGAAERVNLRLRVVDTAGITHFVELEPVLPDAYSEDTPLDDWLTYEATIDPDAFTGDISVVALVTTVFPGPIFAYDDYFLPQRLSVRDLILLDEHDIELPLDWFEDSDWLTAVLINAFPHRLPLPIERDETDTLIYTWEILDPGLAAASFMWQTNYPEIVTLIGVPTRQAINPSVILPPGETQAGDPTTALALPVIISQSAADRYELAPGVRFRLFVNTVELWAEVVDVMTYFPTVYNDTEVFIIADRDTLLYALNDPRNAPFYASEVWLRLEPGIDPQHVIDTLQRDETYTISNVMTVEANRSTQQEDTLVLGLIGLLYLSFLVGMVLSIVSLLTYIMLTVQQRRTEFAVLRAMGLSTARLVGTIALEQVLVMMTAIVLGTILGMLMSSQVLPTLAVTTTGETITPPFIVDLNIGALLAYVGALLLILGVVLGISSVLVRRLATTQALRMGEE